MVYEAEISRENPSAIVFLVDQSASMADPFGGEAQRRKADRLADALNRLLYELSIRCTRDQEEGVRNYYDVGIIGYGAQVGSAFGGVLAGQGMVPLKDVADNPMRLEQRQRRVDDGAGGLTMETTTIPIWIEPAYDNSTPMREAFQEAHGLLAPWVAAHPQSFPPIIINITDGEANEDPTRTAAAVRALSTSDGEAMLFNLHLSSTPAPPSLYPDSDQYLPDKFARQLFAMSSVLPPHLQQSLSAEGYSVGPQSRGFVFNADIVEVIQFLNIGTRPKNMR